MRPYRKVSARNGQRCSVLFVEDSIREVSVTKCQNRVQNTGHPARNGQGYSLFVEDSVGQVPCRKVSEALSE